MLTLHSNNIAYLPNSLGLLDLDEFTYNDNPVDSVLKCEFSIFNALFYSFRYELNALDETLTYIRQQEIPIEYRVEEWLRFLNEAAQGK